MSSLIPLKRLFRIYNGSTPKSSEPDYWDGNIYWTTPEDLGKLKTPYLSNTSRKITQEGYKNCGATIVQPGSLIITSRAPVGNIAISDVEMCTNQGCKSLERIKADRTSPKFYYYYLLAQKESLQSVSRGSTFFEINADDLGAFKVVNFELKTQTKIANCLDQKTAELDQLVRAKQRLLKLLDEKKRTLIAFTVTRGLNPDDAPLKDSGIPWLGKIPVHWEIERTKWLLPEIDERSETGEEDLLSVSHLTGVTLRSEKDVNMFMAESLEGYKKCKAGDLVINTLWAWMGAMGVSPVDGIISPAYNVYRPVSGIESDYIDLLVRTPDFICEITRYSKGVWSSRLRLYPEGLYEACLPVPPLSEQKEIVVEINKQLKQFKELKSITEKTIALLQERRTALISAAVTGKLCEEVLNAG